MEWAPEVLQVFQVWRVKWENQEEQQLDYRALVAERVYRVCQEHQGCRVHYVCIFLTCIFILASKWNKTNNHLNIYFLASEDYSSVNLKCPVGTSLIVTHNPKCMYQQPPCWSEKIQLIVFRVAVWETEAQGCVDTIYDTEDFEVLG